jgi:hypothetical protein
MVFYFIISVFCLHLAALVRPHIRQFCASSHSLTANAWPLISGLLDVHHVLGACSTPEANSTPTKAVHLQGPLDSLAHALCT